MSQSWVENTNMMTASPVYKSDIHLPQSPFTSGLKGWAAGLNTSCPVVGMDIPEAEFMKI
jgi:hypothetical protein